MLRNPHYSNCHCVDFSCKRRGLYYEQLERFWRFFPKEQLLVLNSESFFHKTAATLDRIFQFLKLESDIVHPEYRPVHVGRNKTEVAPEVYDYLGQFFAPHNQKLYREIGRDLGW